MHNMMKRTFAAVFLTALLMTVSGLAVTGPGTGRVEAASKNSVLSGRVNAAIMKVYSEQSASSSVVANLTYNDRVIVLSTGTQWVKVKVGNKEGYARGNQLDTYGGGTAADEGGCAKGQQVANYALHFLGNPYVWGGASLTNGTDCSGFVMSVYRHFGINLPHSSFALRGYGKNVPGLKEAKAGDLICYNGHIAIYLGGNRIVHASGRRSGIKVSPNAAYRPIVAIRRIF